MPACTSCSVLWAPAVPAGSQLMPDPKRKKAMQTCLALHWVVNTASATPQAERNYRELISH